MRWITDELLFYGGIAVAASSSLFASVGLLILQIKRKYLNAQLDMEYGERENRK